jgi:hypothetical protein
VKQKGVTMKSLNRFFAFVIVFVLMVAVSGCKSKDDTANKSKATATSTAAASQPADAYVIEPNVGMGSVRFTMTMKEARQILGKPDRKIGGAYEYTSKGFSILRGKDGKVASITCGDMAGADAPAVKACVCRTSKNIGMGSTEKDIVAAYGPSNSAPQSNTSTVKILAYPSLHAMFTLKDGKVVHMLFTGE